MLDTTILMAAIKAGHVGSGSLLFDEESQRWAPAGEHGVYRAAQRLLAKPDPPSLKAPSASAPKRLEEGSVLVGTGGPSVSRQQVGVVAACCGLAALVREAIVSSGPKQDLAALLSYGIGAGFGAFLLAALFFAWSRRTRPWIPRAMWGLFALQVINLLLEPPTPRRLEVAAELQRLQNTTTEIMAPDPSAANRLDIRGPDAIKQQLIGNRAPALSARSPDSRTARTLRALTLLLQGLKSDIDAKAQAHGVDLNALPDGYLGARYLADASGRTDVQKYFYRYSAYLDDAVATTPAILDSLATASAAQAGLGPTDAAALEKDVRDGIHFLGPEAPMVLSTREFIAAALQLHRFLVRVDPRVRYDAEGDQALFEVDAERIEAIRLAGVVQRKAEKVTTLQRQAYEQTQASAESLAARSH